MPVVPSDSDRETLSATSRLIWIIVAAMLAAICAGYWAAGLSLDIWTCRYVVPIVPLCAAIAWFYRTRRPDPWIAQGAESVAQVLAILLAGTLLTYAAAAACFPYRDHELNATDIALGFDWRAYLNFVNAHPWLGLLCHGAYFSIKLQPVLIIGALVVTGRFHRLRQFALVLAATLAITIFIFMFTPAAGAFAHLGLTAADTPHFTPSMTYEQLKQLDGVRSGALQVIRFDQLEGLIAFPSFHTAAGVIAMWALWPCRGLRWWVIALNAAMITATPVDGAHYFVDVAAGASVAATAILIVVRMPMPALRRRLPPLSPAISR
jgi:membrane-associated phospholipid phosphatase